MEILYKDENIVAINKRSGELVVPPRNYKAPGTEGKANDEGVGVGIGDSEADEINGDPQKRVILSHVVAKELNLERVFVVHRLDQDTSGVLLFALNEEYHKKLCKLFEHNLIKKHYRAIVQGTMKKDEGSIRFSIMADPRRKKRGKMVLGDKFHGKPSFTEYKVARAWGKYTMLDVYPKTGRTHQIRVHMRGIGHPLAIDPWYGEFQGTPGPTKLGPMVRLTLHAEDIEIEELNLKIHAPLHEDFEGLIKWLDTVFPVG